MAIARRGRKCLPDTATGGTWKDGGLKKQGQVVLFRDALYVGECADACTGSRRDPPDGQGHAGSRRRAPTSTFVFLGQLPA